MKILISRSEPRSKYLESIKDALRWFDICFDASSMLKDGSDGRLPALDSKYYSDLIPGFTKIHSIADFYEAISGLNIEHAVFFDPKRQNQKIELMVRLCKSQGSKVHFLLNRHTVDLIRLGNFLRVAGHKPLSAINRKALRIDTILAPSRFSLASWAGRLRSNRWIFTKHIWSPAVSERVDVPQQLMFADSYLPFHQESVRHGEVPAADKFYARLMEAIQLIAANAMVSQVWFSKHPNSRGEEDMYIREPAMAVSGLSEGKEFQDTGTVWSFGSASAHLALAAGKKTYFLTFPDLLPKKKNDLIVEKGKNLGIEVYQFDGQILRSAFRLTPLFFLRRRMARVVFKTLYSGKRLPVEEALRLCDSSTPNCGRYS